MAPQFSNGKNKIIMDTEFIKQYGEDILCYNLRTARQKKRMQYKDFDKRLIGLHKEEKALYEQKRNLGWEPLHPPVQKGWKRFFVLRDDVAKSRHAVFFEDILKNINTCTWSHRKDFKVKKRRFGKKSYVVKPQYLLKLNSRKFEELNFSDREKQFFHEVWEYDWSKVLVKKFVFTELWRYRLIVKPNMIDRIRKIDAELETRLDEIDEYLEKNNYRGKQIKLVHGRGWRSRSGLEHEKYNEENPLKNKSLSRVLDECLHN
jgi:hypothetical protein